MEVDSSSAPPSVPREPVIRPWEGLLLGVIAGLLVWAVIQAAHPVFHVPQRFHIAGIGAPVELHEAFQREQDRVDRWHAMLYLGLVGLTLGAALGGRILVATRSWRAILLSLPLGLVGGTIGGSLAPLLFVWARDKVGQADLLQIVEAQLLIGVPLGLFAGLGLGLAGGNIKSTVRCVVAGTLGGVLFAVLYPLAVAVLLPTANTEVLLPEEAITRLVWLTLLGGSVGLVLSTARSARLPRQRDAGEPQRGTTTHENTLAPTQPLATDETQRGAAATPNTDERTETKRE